MKVNVLEEIELFNASEEGYVLGSPYLTTPPEGLSVSNGGSYAYLEPGTYMLEVVEVKGTAWFLIPGTIWGAYEETWGEYVDGGECKWVEEGGIDFAHYVQQYLGRGIYEDIGRNRNLELSLDGLRIVESTVYFPEGSITKGFEVLSTRTIGYLPINTIVEDSDTGREADKRIILEG